MYTSRACVLLGSVLRYLANSHVGSKYAKYAHATCPCATLSLPQKLNISSQACVSTSKPISRVGAHVYVCVVQFCYFQCKGFHTNTFYAK